MPKTKVTFNLSEELVDVLRDMAEKTDTTMTDVLKQAIAVQKYLSEEQEAGHEVMIRDPDHDTYTKLVFK